MSDTTPQLPPVELTERSRYRKLSLCMAVALTAHVVQYLAKQPVTWPLVALDAIIVVAFVAGNVLARLANATAVQQAVQRLQGLVGGGSGER